MKTLFLSLMFLLAFNSFSMEKEKDVYGKWKLQINMKEKLKEESKELNLLERMIVGGVSGMVEAVWEKIELTFEFKRNNELLLHIKVEDEETEIEELSWSMTNGRIYIDDIDHPNVNIDKDGFWMLKGKNLLSYDENGQLNRTISMTRK